MSSEGSVSAFFTHRLFNVEYLSINPKFGQIILCFFPLTKPIMFICILQSLYPLHCVLLYLYVLVLFFALYFLSEIFKYQNVACSVSYSIHFYFNYHSQSSFSHIHSFTNLKMMFSLSWASVTVLNVIILSSHLIFTKLVAVQCYCFSLISDKQRYRNVE